MLCPYLGSTTLLILKMDIEENNVTGHLLILNSTSMSLLQVEHNSNYATQKITVSAAKVQD